MTATLPATIETEPAIDLIVHWIDLVAEIGRMAPGLDLPRALLRGRFMAAAAAIEWTGVPIDVPALTRLRNGWDGIKTQLISEIDSRRGFCRDGSPPPDPPRELARRREVGARKQAHGKSAAQDRRERRAG